MTMIRSFESESRTGAKVCRHGEPRGLGESGNSWTKQTVGKIKDWKFLSDTYPGNRLCPDSPDCALSCRN